MSNIRTCTMSWQGNMIPLIVRWLASFLVTLLCFSAALIVNQWFWGLGAFLMTLFCFWTALIVSRWFWEVWA